MSSERILPASFLGISPNLTQCERQAAPNKKASTEALYLAGAFLARSSAALASRSELGRVRALGASRVSLIFVSVSEDVIAASVGVAVAFATICALSMVGLAPLRLNWIAPAAALVLLSDLVASIPSLMYASFLDPGKVLRVP